MKLAEALQLRADLQKRMGQLAERLHQNARVQEGEKPAEDPVELLAEYEDCAGQLEELMARINRTNCETRTEKGTLTELLAKRDCLKLRVQTYHDFLMSASSLTQRGMRTEIRVFSTVPVPEYRKKADALSRQLRETDNAIQAANWTTELL
ncbi:MAG: DIP1984 family protein [Oscillospiraceae bacterium]|nr:DIP1984 family protein [Oscillospiraceae bacterium]